jgi:hypothetical protein
MKKDFDRLCGSLDSLILKGLTWLVYGLAVLFVVTAVLTFAVVGNVLASLGFFGFLAYWKTCIIVFALYVLLVLREPKGTPDKVERKIREAFQSNAELNARRIDVEICDNKVTLRGGVSSRAEYDQAASAAWDVPGVTDVDNELTVGP